MWLQLAVGYGLLLLLGKKNAPASLVAPASTQPGSDLTTVYPSTQEALSPGSTPPPAVTPITQGPTSMFPLIPPGEEGAGKPVATGILPGQTNNPDQSVVQPILVTSHPIVAANQLVNPQSSPSPTSNPTAVGYGLASKSQPITDSPVFQPNQIPPAGGMLWDSLAIVWVVNDYPTPQIAGVNGGGTTGVPGTPDIKQSGVLKSGAYLVAYARFPYYSWTDGSGTIQISVNSPV